MLQQMLSTVLSQVTFNNVLSGISILISLVTLGLAIVIAIKQGQDFHKGIIDQQAHALSTLITSWRDELKPLIRAAGAGDGVNRPPQGQPLDLESFEARYKYEDGLCAIKKTLEKYQGRREEVRAVLREAEAFKNTAKGLKQGIPLGNVNPDALELAYHTVQNKIIHLLARD